MAVLGKSEPEQGLREVFGTDLEKVCEKLPLLVQLFDYWEAIRGERSMPRRADFDPLDIPKLLSRITLIEVLNDNPDGMGRFRYRILGQDEAEKRRKNPIGQLVEEGYFDYSPSNAVETYLKVCQSAQPFYETRSFMAPDSRFIRESTIILPLSNEGSRVTHIVALSERLWPGA